MAHVETVKLAADILPITAANSCAVMVSFVAICLQLFMICFIFSAGKSSFIEVMSTWRCK